MKNSLYKILLFSALLIIVALTLYFKNVVEPSHVREHYNEDAKESRAIRKARVEEIEKSEKERYQRAEKVQIFDEEVDELNRGLNILEQKIQSRQIYCLKVLNETIESDEYIDINTEMYNDIELIKEKFSTVLNEAMLRPEADELFSTVYKAVESDPKVDPRLLFARLERIDICRDAKSLNFIDTVFEAYRLKNWPRSVGIEILTDVTTVIKSTLEKNKSVENLLYFTNALLIMSDNGLVPANYTSELEDLSRRINENHSMFKEVFGNQQTREDNFITLSDYLRKNEELSIELRQVTADIENVSGINY